MITRIGASFVSACSMLESEMILAISLCEAGGYVVTYSSFPSASATNANVGGDPHLVLVVHLPFRLGLISGLGSYEVSRVIGVSVLHGA